MSASSDASVEALLDEGLAAALSPRNFVAEGDCMFAKGAHIGDFEALMRLGNSALGELYLVRNVVTRKRFAMKVLPPEACVGPKFEKRFAETRAALPSRIHPHIVHIQKMGCHSDVFDYHYIVMDYIESSLGRPQTLQDVFNESGKLSEGKTCKIVLQICDALDFASNCKGGSFHHSDLKPSNILFDAANLPRLTDFDAAKLPGRAYIKDVVRHCVNKAQSANEECNPSLKSAEAVPKPPSPSPAKMDQTKSSIFLHVRNFKLKDLGLSNFVKSDYVKGLLKALSLGYGGGREHGGPEKSLKRSRQSGSPTGLTAINSILESFDYMSPEQKAGEEPDERSNIYSLGLLLYRMLTGRKMSGCWDLPSKFGVSKGWDEVIVRCLKREPEERFQSFSELKAAIREAHTRRFSPVHALGVAAAIIAVLAAVLWIEGFGSGLVSFGRIGVLTKISHKSLERVPVSIKVTPAGAKVQVFKDGVLAASAESIPAEGLSFIAESAKYMVEAQAKGCQSFRQEFEFSPSLSKEFVLSLPRAGEPVVHLGSDGFDAPRLGFAWKIDEMKILMIPVPRGSFLSGCKLPREKRLPEERPAVMAKVAESFWISEKEISQWQYERLMRGNLSVFKSPEAPVEKISLKNAEEFCKRLNDLEREAGRLPEGFVYRLPTELEWEYCARAGSDGVYSFGDDPARLPEYACFGGDGDGQAKTCGSLKPNAWGIYDMQGNVWELCMDILKRSKTNERTEPVFVYVARGGDWSSNAAEVRPSSRRIVKSIDKPSANGSIGFRVALAPPLDSAIVEDSP